MNMNDEYQYSPELFSLLVETIPLLCKSKKDVILFFKGAGVAESDISDLDDRVKKDRENIYKFEIVRTVLQRINEKGDSELRTRREVLKRVVEFDNFSGCWENDRQKAKGFVSDIRQIQNVRDSFTRMNLERAKERAKRIKEQDEKTNKEKHRQSKIEAIKKELSSLFAMNDQPQKRGKLLEKTLNGLFRVYGILAKEDFHRVDVDGAGVIEQIDGIIELDSHTYYAEMKWVKEPIGVDNVSQHLVRIFSRPDARAIFISAYGYTTAAITQCKNALAHKVVIMCTLKEFVHLLENKSDLIELLKTKIRAALDEKNPFLEIVK